MWPSSVRRVVVATAAPQAPVLSTISSTASRTVAFSCRPNRHQRRCSSSKPSSPDNGTKTIPAVKSAPATTQPAKSAADKRKPGWKARDASNKVPSVPSTQHLPQESIALSNFFSQHRPISITHSLPKTTTEDAFAVIFAPKTRAQKSSEVMDTLSRTVRELEAPMANLSLNGESDGDQLVDNVHRIELKHPDGSESSIYVQLNTMSGQFLPYQPPPAPKPASEVAADAAAAEAEAADAEAEAAEEHQEPQRRVYKAVLTIEEQVDANGEIKIVAHSPQVIMDPPPAPRSFLERMAIRHLRYEDARRQRLEDHQQREKHEREGAGETMEAISVKRQRKLKMKKKKYKKLMKRTRNERQKLQRG